MDYRYVPDGVRRSITRLGYIANQTLEQKVGSIVIALAAAIGGSVLAIFQVKKPT